MSMVMLNLHCQVMVSEDSADFRLLVSATGESGQNVATIADLPLDDEQLGEKLRLITQAFRMGARVGKSV